MKTDLTLLRALLDAGLRGLSAGEERSFKSMLRDLESGHLVQLSKSQRLWVEGKYNHLDLDRAYRDKPPPKPKVKVTRGPPGPELVWNKPKPLKPPGK